MTSLQLCLILVVLVTQTGKIYGETLTKSSLTFVIDDTGSMYDEIEQVKASVNTIFDTVAMSNKSQIENFILVTFNDPDAHLLTVTKDKDTFKTALKGINIHGGGDCPEYAMKGIKVAIENSLPFSYVYVFTDASAHDHIRYEEIKSISQKKQTQVTFLLTGDCGLRSDADYQVYHKIAKATSGQVFNMLKQDVEDVLKYIVESIKGRANVLVDETFPPGTHEIKIPVDKNIDDLTISVAGRNPTISVSNPEGKTLPTKDIVKKTEIKIVTVPKEKSGIYTAKVGSTSEKSVKVTGKTAIDFQHGFSAFEPTSLSETATRPAADGSTYLSIQLIGKGVIFQTAKILDMSGNTLEELPLRLINEKTKFYVTKQFNPPNVTFRISVFGYDEESKAPVNRLGATPIERQNPKYEATAETAPKVTIIGGPKIDVNYNAPVQVKCKVYGYPKPDIIWNDKDTGVIMPSEVLTIEAPNDFVSILKIEKSTKNSTYECKATNKLGENKDYVKLELKTYFNIMKTPDAITEIQYDKEVTIECRVDALPPPTVNWYKNGKKLTNDTNNIIASDMGSVTIKHMNIESQGNFVCEVANGLQRKLFYSEVVVSGLVEPKLDKTEEKYIVPVGDDEELECRILEGIPRPVIQWFFQSPHDDKFRQINYTKEILRLKDVTFDQVGTYLCTATNDKGTDRYAVELVVEYPPKIKDTVRTIRAKDGDIVSIPCDVNGAPNPTVKWFKKNTLVDDTSGDFKISDNHTLQFRAKIMFNNGLYTCKAENPLGSDKRTVLVNIFDPPRIEIPKVFTVNTTLGRDEFLPCRADGHPRPRINWIYNDIRGKSTKEIWHREGVLRLRNMQLSDQGYYTCVATNVVGSSRITYKVNVYAPPVIERPYSDTTFRAVKGDLLLKIPCKATGGPEPTIVWKKEDFNIAFGSEWYDVDNGTLIIKNIDEKSQGKYTCIAQNSIGNDTVDYILTVTDYPLTNDSVSTIYVEEGQTVDVPCDIPHKIIDAIRWYKDRKLIPGNTVTLNKVTLKDAGIYSCRVSDFEKSSSAHIRVVVGSKPSFTTEEEEDIEFLEGDFVRLVCEARGEPIPEVSWWLNDDQLDATDMNYDLEMKLDNRGRYTCEVRNPFGSIRRSFNIVTKDCILDTRKDFLRKNQPLMLSPSFTWPSFDIYEGYMIMSKDDFFFLHCNTKFSKFPSRQTVKAYCEGGSNISIDEKIFKYRDIECIEENEPTVRSKGTSCHPGNTEYVEIGYKVYDTFLQVYDVCLDKDKNLPLYARHEISTAHYGVSKNGDKWFTHDLLPLDFDAMYYCKNQAADISLTLGKPFLSYDDCCFEKKQLVSPKDLTPGVPTAAVYSYLNVVPHWSTCNSKNWAAIEENVRKFASSFENELTVWTGTADRYSTSRSSSHKNIAIHDQRGGKQSVPQYLWKVVQDPASFSSLAIIQVNVPDVSREDISAYIHCRDICDEIEWMQSRSWRNVEDGYTYCCSILDFESAFNYYGRFSRYKTSILYNDRSMPKYYYST